MFRIITGAVITIVGLGFLLGGIFDKNISAILSVFVIAIGMTIVLNKQEDEIEQIKSDKQINHE